MKTPSRKEAAALARLDNVGAAEMNREQWWHMLPMVERQRAVSLAGFTSECASWPLAMFTDAERYKIRNAIHAHVTNMQLIARCMHGHNTNVKGLLH